MIESLEALTSWTIPPVYITDEEIISKRKVKPLFFSLCQTLGLRFEKGYTMAEQKFSSNIIISNDDFLGNSSI